MHVLKIRWSKPLEFSTGIMSYINDGVNTGSGKFRYVMAPRLNALCGAPGLQPSPKSGSECMRFFHSGV